MKSFYKILIALLILMCFTFLVLNINKQEEKSSNNDIEIIKFSDLEKLIKTNTTEQISIINFWATWCRPCVMEIPYFEKISKLYKKEQLKVYLISLDDVNDLKLKVEPFVKKRELVSNVKLLDEVDFNSWIDKVDTKWSGAIPATLLINHKTSKRLFYEGELSEEQLNNLLNQIKYYDEKNK